MSYLNIPRSVLEIKKIKTMARMDIRYNHDFRKSYCKGVDFSKSESNKILKDTENLTLREVFDDRIKGSTYYQGNKEKGISRHKVAKNAVLGIDVICGFSKEAMPLVNIDEWCKNTLEWAKNNFCENNNDNIAYAVLHLEDESTPHIHIVIIPLDRNGRLNANKYIGGKGTFSKLQTSYHKETLEKYGVERGVKGSRASQETLRRFGAVLNKAIGIEIPKEIKAKSIEEIIEYAEESLQDKELQLIAMKNKHKEEMNIKNTEIYNMKRKLYGIEKANEMIDEEIDKLNETREHKINYPVELAESGSLLIKAMENAREDGDPDYDKVIAFLERNYIKKIEKENTKKDKISINEKKKRLSEIVNFIIDEDSLKKKKRQKQEKSL